VPPTTPASGAHRVSKLYYMADTQAALDAYQRAFGAFAKVVDGQTRRPMTWPEWAITTRIDVREHADTVWRAIACHASQLDETRRLEELQAETKRALFAEHTFYRAFSLVNGGRGVERDLFEGLR
jgi:LmbE family N-acetylglucosaminyl deacetylase